MSDNQTSPNSRDWLLLIGGSTYKFTLTGFLSGRAGRYFEKSQLQPEPTELDTFNRRYRSGEGIVCRTDGAAAGRAVRVVSRLAADGDTGAFGSVRADGLYRHNAELRAAFDLLRTAAPAMSAVYGCAMLGLSCIVLPHRERGFGGVIQTMAARGGKMIGGALVLWLYQEYGQTAAAGFMLAFSLLMLLQLLYYREPESPTAQGSWTVLAARLVSFWQQPETGWRWLVFCLPLPHRMRLRRRLLCPSWRIWASTRSRRAGFWRWAFLLPA